MVKNFVRENKAGLKAWRVSRGDTLSPEVIREGLLDRALAEVRERVCGPLVDRGPRSLLLIYLQCY